VKDVHSDVPSQTSEQSAGAPPSGGLHRVLGNAFGLALIVGGVIGLGIFRTPGTIAEHLPHPALIIGVWVLGAGFSWLGSTSVAELAAAIPRSGGFFPYAERAFGPFAGFVAGSSDLLSSAGTVAAGSFVFGEYLGRLVPMHAGLLAVVVLYILLNVALLAVLPVADMRGQALVAGTAAGWVFGRSGDSIIAVVAMIGLLSAVNASQLSTSRIIYSLNRAGLVQGPFGRVNAGGTPSAALLAGSIVALAMVATGSFERVLAITAFYMAANYVIVLAAVFVLRRREPELARPYRARGYPWTTGFGLVGFIAFLAGAVASDTTNSLVALAGFGVTIPAFYLLRSREAKQN
ncbi:MAG: amino acid permease, partial [Gemmatimonadota bacterium]